MPWLQKVDHAVRTQHTLIRNMSAEIFARNLGVQPEDEEWGVRREALNDWELWGRPGTGYEHLPRIRGEDLYRREVNPESVQGEEEGKEEGGSESESESEDERHEQVLLQLDANEGEESEEAESTGEEEEEEEE